MPGSAERRRGAAPPGPDARGRSRQRCAPAGRRRCPVQDLTPLLDTARTYLLRFSATNTTSARVTVLPSVVTSVVVDPLTAPHPLFPIVPYLGAAAFLAYGVARLWGVSRGGAGAI